jgi:hypothetical protein
MITDIFVLPRLSSSDPASRSLDVKLAPLTGQAERPFGAGSSDDVSELRGRAVGHGKSGEHHAPEQTVRLLAVLVFVPRVGETHADPAIRWFAGPYASADGSHADAFRTFATRVEKLIQKEVDAYITEVATEKHGSSGSG